MKDDNYTLQVPDNISMLEIGSSVVLEPVFTDPYEVREVLRTSPSLNYVLDKHSPGIVDNWLEVFPVPVPEQFLSLGSKDLAAYTYYKLTDEIVAITNSYARFEDTLAPSISIARLILTYASNPEIRKKMLHKAATPNLLWNDLVRKASIDEDDEDDTDHIMEEAYDTYGRIRLDNLSAQRSLRRLDGVFTDPSVTPSELAYCTRRTRKTFKKSPWLNYVNNFTPKTTT